MHSVGFWWHLESNPGHKIKHLKSLLNHLIKSLLINRHLREIVNIYRIRNALILKNWQNKKKYFIICYVYICIYNLFHFKINLFEICGVWVSTKLNLNFSNDMQCKKQRIKGMILYYPNISIWFFKKKFREIEYYWSRIKGEIKLTFDKFEEVYLHVWTPFFFLLGVCAFLESLLAKYLHL